MTKEPQSHLKPPVQMSYIKDKPTFDENGVCCIDEIDIEYIAYGVGILGYGAGGESHHCKLWALDLLQQGEYSMRVVPYNHFRLSKGLISDVASMGAPTVSNELLPNGRECLNALKTLEEYIGEENVALFSGEIGGSNGLMGLIVAAIRNIPCLDCDSLGRAFPCLDHTLAFIRGSPSTPASLCDVRDNTGVCKKDEAKNAKELENLFRIECTKRGLTMDICLPPFTGDQVEKYCLPNSVSRAWFIGQAKFKNRTNTIEAVVKAGQARILISNVKVINVERVTADGFVRSCVKIETNQGIIVHIDFQNENLIVQRDNNEILATAPNLIN